MTRVTRGGRRSWRSVLRWLIPTLVVVSLIGMAGGAWYYSDQVLSTDRTVTYEASASPLGQGKVSLVGTDQYYIAQPGHYGLAWAGGYGAVGPVLSQDSGAVMRSYSPRHGDLMPGTPAYVDPFAFDGDPRTARDLAFQDVSIGTELGPMPAWYVPAAAGKNAATWVIFVHGRGADRAESLRVLPPLHEAGLPILVVSYRNDKGVPAAPDRHDHLGDTEWQDVDAAAQWAVDHGAQRLVLAGWSLGGAISLQFADRSAMRDRVVALILDSPVLDWRDVLYHQGEEKKLPRPLTATAQWTIERRLGLTFDRFDWVHRAGELSRPMMIFVGDTDITVPVGPARRLAGLRPELVTLVEQANVGHTRSWNADPAAYESAVTQWVSTTIDR